MRLSKYCTDLLNISRREAKELIKKGYISLDGKIIIQDIKVLGSENISSNLRLTEHNYSVNNFLLFQSSMYLFLYKPPFMHSDRIKSTDPLTMSDIFKKFTKFRMLSRLDYEADGILAAIHNGINLYKIEKTYLAIVEGLFPKEISLSCQIDAHKRKKVKVINNNNGYKTNMKLIDYANNYSLIEVTLEKAARHQVRAFCSYLGHSIAGDKLYGKNNYKRLCLHCKKYTINNVSVTCDDKTENFINIFHTIAYQNKNNDC